MPEEMARLQSIPASILVVIQSDRPGWIPRKRIYRKESAPFDRNMIMVCRTLWFEFGINLQSFKAAIATNKGQSKKKCRKEKIWYTWAETMLMTVLEFLDLIDFSHFSADILSLYNYVYTFIDPRCCFSIFGIHNKWKENNSAHFRDFCIIPQIPNIVR